MPQLVQRPGHPSYVTPSSQPIQMPYVQTRPLTSVPPQSQQNVAAPNNHMHGLGAHGLPLSSPYTVIPNFITCWLLAFSVNSRIHLFIYYYYSFCLVYSLSIFNWHPDVGFISQFQPMSQMHAPVSVGNSQPWLSSASQTTNLVSPIDQANQHSSVSAVNPVCSAFLVCFCLFLYSLIGELILILYENMPEMDFNLLFVFLFFLPYFVIAISLLLTYWKCWFIYQGLDKWS